MDPIAHLARALKGQALVDAAARHLHSQLSDPKSLPASDPHWERRALKMLRQRGINPFARPTAAPDRWPYAEHRTVGQADRDLAWEQSRNAAVRQNSFHHAAEQ